MGKYLKVIPVLAGMAILLVAAGCGPSTAEQCLDRASVAASGEKWSRALKWSEKAVELAPGNIDALLFKAVAALKCGQQDVAFDAASRAVNLSPENFAARYTMGRVCMVDPSRSGEAMRSLIYALKLRRDDRNTLVLLCNLSSEVGSPNALTFLTMLQRNPEFASSPVLYNQLALAWLRRGDPARARSAFVNAWRLDKDNPLILYNTARFFDRHTKSASSAITLYRRYLQLASDAPGSADMRTLAAKRLEVLGGAR